MKTKALAPWFGANRILAVSVGQQLKGCKWVGVPFCGGCSELPFIDCRGGIANDIHRHIINLARVISDPSMKVALVQRLDNLLYHPDTLAKAQARLRQREEESQSSGLFNSGRPPFVPANLYWAEDYFVSCWMGRGGKAGTASEFKGALPSRWNANGGGSNVRYRSMVESLDSWHQVCKHWEWECMDAFDFLAGIHDQKGHGVYVDAPWPDAGAEYKHDFPETSQRRLAKILGGFQNARVVIRYGDHPLIQELYPRDRWTWFMQESRDQANQGVGEVLILNGPSFVEAA